MEFEWDEIKSDDCYRVRNFDFEFVIACFFDPNRVIFQDKRWEYGEDRFQILGKIEQRLFFVAYTLRRSRIRIISARKANRREVQEYEKYSNYNQ